MYIFKAGLIIIIIIIMFYLAHINVLTLDFYTLVKAVKDDTYAV